MPTAIQTMKKSLQRTQRAQVECCNTNGSIKPYMRQRYIILTGKARNLRESIEWMEEMKATVNV